MYIKICGITKPEQALAIANAGVSCLGFICVPTSPRYVSPRDIADVAAAFLIDKVGVFLDTDLEMITKYVKQGNLNGIQLHGNESPQFCDQVKTKFPDLKLIKAFRVKNKANLDQVHTYTSHVDVVLLDAYDPQLAGGTGKTIDWANLQDFEPNCEWWLAGGLSPENVGTALGQLQPHGIDVSSGVERSPGDKDLKLVKRLLAEITC